MRVHVTNIMHVTGWTVCTSSTCFYHHPPPTTTQPHVWTGQPSSNFIVSSAAFWTGQPSSNGCVHLIFMQGCVLVAFLTRFGLGNPGQMLPFFFLCRTRVFDMLWPRKPRTNVTPFSLMELMYFTLMMANKSKCPGCKKDFMKGCPFLVHLTSCKLIASAVDMALRKHKANSAKKLESAKSTIAKCRELAAEVNWNEEPAVDPLPDLQEMAVDTNVGSPPRSPSPPPRPSGRPGRWIRLLRRYRDELPPNPNPIIIMNPEPEEEPEVRALPELIEIPESSVFCTEKNSFGVYCKYALGPPTITLDEAFTLSSVSDSISITCDPADAPSNVETPPLQLLCPIFKCVDILANKLVLQLKGYHILQWGGQACPQGHSAWGFQCSWLWANVFNLSWT